ncbi:MAG: hypothetical protein LBN98_01035 [Prevotellaceae bacterium]|jgi:hypothetical protein|nr:hypothetical protein [Prevotellaceae bacterium]
MKRDLIEYIARQVHTYWKNGKVGFFMDMDNNYLLRFRETDETAKHYLIGDSHTEELRALPILACGFVGWLIKHWGNDVQATNEEYLLIRLKMYSDEHRNDDDADLRNLEEEFYSTYKAKEEQWVKQSEAIFEYLPDGDIQRIKGKIARFFRYLDSKIATKRNYEFNPLYFTRSFTTDEQKKLFDGLVNGGFLPKETICSHFYYVFGGTPIPDNEKPFKPLIWQKSVGLLAYCIENLFADTDGANLWEITVNTFLWKGTPPNKDTMKNTVSKYKHDFQHRPKGYREIDDIIEHI